MENQAPYNVSPEESQEALDMLGKGYKIAGRESTIFRVIKSKDNPYVMIDRRPITSPALSYKAKGILTYLLSRPDGWEVNVPDLVNHSTDGAAAIRTGLKELRDAHHIAYNPTRHLAGRYITKWVIEVYEIPYDLPTEAIIEEQAEVDLDSDFSNVGHDIDSENLQVGNRGEVLKNLSNNENNDRFKEIVKKVSELRGGAITPMDAELIDYWIPKHTDYWIDEALKRTKAKGARSAQYTDTILQGWEANGYPKSRAEKVNERKATPSGSSKQDQSLANIQSWLAKKKEAQNG